MESPPSKTLFGCNSVSFGRTTISVIPFERAQNDASGAIFVVEIPCGNSESETENCFQKSAAIAPVYAHFVGNDSRKNR